MNKKVILIFSTILLLVLTIGFFILKKDTVFKTDNTSSQFGITQFLESNRVVGKKGVLYPFSILEEKGPWWVDYIVRGIVTSKPHKTSEGYYSFTMESTFSTDSGPVKLNVLMGPPEFSSLVYISPREGLEASQGYNATKVADLAELIIPGNEIQVNFTVSYTKVKSPCDGDCLIFKNLIDKFGSNSMQYFSSKGNSGNADQLAVASKFIIVK